MKVHDHLALLGLEVRDKLTGFAGVVGSVSFDISGCVQALVTPKAKNGVIPDSRWLDTLRLKVTKSEPAIPRPAFGEDIGDAGPVEKPMLGRY